ncbi:FdtA/QdtA family cupin domain-containing protein [Prochlorococcus sp. MIT 1341]|uniref:sugar 3,4-ketoisomerase n=1 Tax=Prochlorococcus sp. MIT 1341 TaxID=3096221 RepID=UPI002A74E2D5|nr:FdtA/QdtA family cupin domain-containing protein [Prochlorococcus sp. MIT 1341]
MYPLKSINLVKEILVSDVAEENSSLAYIEGNDQVPFSIKRVFYIYDVKANEIRGRHAHKLCNQFLICLAGEVEVICDDGLQKKTFTLKSPLEGLHIPPTIWAEQIYKTTGSIMLVLTDRKYDESDYIRNYKRFLEYRERDF